MSLHLPSPRIYQTELLECRRLFVGFTVTGTSGADAISVRADGTDIVTVVNGVSDTHSDFIFNEFTIDCLGGNDTITINSNGGNTVTINGSTGADTLNFGLDDNTVSIGSDIAFNAGSEVDTLNLFDSATPQLRRFTLTPTTLEIGSSLINLSGVNEINIDGGAPNDTLLDLVGEPPVNVTFDGNTSAFTTDVITFTGTASDNVTVSPSSNGSTFSTITYGTHTITAAGIDGIQGDTTSVTYLAQPTSAQLTINKPALNGNEIIYSNSPMGIRFNGHDFAAFTIDTATNDLPNSQDQINMSVEWDMSPTLGLNMGDGTNNFIAGGLVQLNAQLGAFGGQNVNVSATNGATVTLVGSQTLNILDIGENATLKLVGGTNITTSQLRSLNVGGTFTLLAGQTLNVTQRFFVDNSSTLIRTGSGGVNITSDTVLPHGIGATFRLEGGSTTFNSDVGSTTTANLSLVQANGTALFTSTMHWASLTVFGGLARVLPNGARTIVTSAFSVNGQGQFDLMNNALIVNYSGTSPIATIDARIRTGFNNGTWNGPGITSSNSAGSPTLRLGSGEASDLFTTTSPVFLGETIDLTTVLVRHTLMGDATLDRTVNFSDLLVLASNYNATGKRWTQGNLDFDAGGNVNFSDLLALAGNYNATLAGSLAGDAGAKGETLDNDRSPAEDVLA
ncbi:MAG: hypothetical protein QM770_11185 [Tepidisphaeraceae bacterium]